MGEDYRLFNLFARREKTGVPVRAILLQSALTILFIVTATFESILVFSGFVLGLNSLATVMGLFWLRRKGPKIEDPSLYRTPFYPWPPLIFCGLMLWTLIFLALNRIEEVAYAAALIGTGFLVYPFVANKTNSDSRSQVEE
jgi:APA family basic amino acid/polyamine antiporter